MKKHILALLVSVASTAVLAGVPAGGATRTGLGQDAPNEPPMLRNLKLTDPLVQQKYMNEPDLLRFLRATYSEACTRGLLNDATKLVKLDPKKQFAQAARDAATQLADSRRIWKMGSFEMEALFGRSYLYSANYCDCIMKELSDVELVNPRKGLEVVEKLPKATQSMCERQAGEQTDKQMARNAKKD